MDIKQIIIQSLREVSSFIETEGDDFDMREYIYDSISFISFIVEIENNLGIYFPDEMLDFENLTSFNGFAELIDSLISEKSTN